MIPHKQLNYHDPNNGIYGDCGRTVIACLLEMEPEEVPHFWDGEETAHDPTIDCRRWLDERGCIMYRFGFNAEGILEDLQGVLDYVGNLNPDQYWVLMGRSENDTNHVVVCKGNQIVHDPALDNSGIIGPCLEGCWIVEIYARKLP